MVRRCVRLYGWLILFLKIEWLNIPNLSRRWSSTLQMENRQMAIPIRLLLLSESWKPRMGTCCCLICTFPPVARLRSFFQTAKADWLNRTNMLHCCSTCRAICLLLCGAQRAIWGIRSLIQRVDLCSMQKFRTQFNFWTSAREQQICGRNHARFGSSFLVAQSRS